MVYLYIAHDSFITYGRYRGIKAEHHTLVQNPTALNALTKGIPQNFWMTPLRNCIILRPSVIVNFIVPNDET